MFAIIALTFSCMKVITAAQSYKGKTFKLKFHQWLAFSIGWAGMRAELFEKLGSKRLPNAWPMIRFGVSRIIVGFVLILMARKFALLGLNYYLLNSMLLVGLSLILHFGLLSISAGMWQLQGVNTYYLFNKPTISTSLTEFWGKRWNIAFSEMTAIAIFRPLISTIGSYAALIAAFLFSGLLHEIALSLPVNSGYGLPSLYFIIQSIVVLFEKIIKKRYIRFLNNRIIARLWVLFWLIAPIPLLFYTQFIKQVIWPLVFLYK